MTLKEQLQDLENQALELRSKMEALREVWRKNVRETLYLQDPSKIRNVEVRSASYCDDPDDLKKRKVIEFRLGDFCTLTVGEDRDKDFDISTTGYFTYDVGDIPKLEEASSMFVLAMAIVNNARNGGLVPFVLKGYKEVVESEEYIDTKAKLYDIYKQSNLVQEAIRAEETTARNQAQASKRVVGTILKRSSRGSFGTHFAFATHVTPKKVKLYNCSFYDEISSDENGKEFVVKSAVEKGLEFIQKNRAALIDNQRGEWVKNEDLHFYEIFDSTK